MDVNSSLNMSKELELEIRKRYAKDCQGMFAATKLLLDNLLEEFCRHFNGLYEYSTRIKNIDSLLAKVSTKISKGADIKSYDDVLEIVKDIIGCRLVVFAPNKLIEVHHILETYETNKQFILNEVTVHSNDDEYSKIKDAVETSCKMNGVDFIPKDPKSGYFGIHYLYDLTPIHDMYDYCNVKFYPKFELQLRTLLQHTWSEIEHKLVYKKSAGSDDNNLGRDFISLSLTLAANDKVLDKIYKEVEPLPSFGPMDFNSQSYPERFKSLMTSVKEIMDIFTANGDKPSSLYGKEFATVNRDIVEKYFGDIKSLIEEPETENVQSAYDTAELLLKTEHYEMALQLYMTYVDMEPFNGVIFLRLAECYDGLIKNSIGNYSRADSLAYLKKLKLFLESTTNNFTDKDVVCHGASVFLWRYQQFSEACWFSDMAISSQNDNDCEKRLKYKLNNCYFSLDKVNDDYSKGILIENDKYQSILAIGDNMEKAITEYGDLSNFPTAKNIPSMYDTIAYTYFHMADVYCDIDKRQALKFARAAVKNINECITYAKNSGLTVRQIWNSHKSDIGMLVAELVEDILPDDE